MLGGTKCVSNNLPESGGAARNRMTAAAAWCAGVVMLIATACELGFVPLECAWQTAPATRRPTDRTVLLQVGSDLPVGPERAVVPAPSPIAEGNPGPMIDNLARGPVESVPPLAPSPSLGLTLDQAINLCLTNDPKIRAGLEAVNQARGDAWTASLRPNPELNVAGGLLPRS